MTTAYITATQSVIVAILITLITICNYADGPGDNVCDDCWDNTTKNAVVAGRCFRRDNMYMREGDWYCRSCYEEREEEAPEPMTEHEILGEPKTCRKLCPLRMY